MELENAEELTRKIRQQNRKDKKQQQLDMVKEHLDERDIHMGIRWMKNDYKPRPFARKGTNKEYVPIEKIAETSAKYLGDEHWGKPKNNKHKNINKEKIIKEQLEFNTAPPTIKEVKRAVRRLKRHKAPGPDEIPAEFFKELDDEGLEEIRLILETWWEKEEVPDEIMEAKIALIYNKGDSTKCENYRPISLLNTMYKLMSSIMVKRIQKGVDHKLHETQYGFRKDRSTADAIHSVRNVLTQSRGTNDDNIVVLLDWEKAFDKVTHEALFLTLERLNIDEKLINLVKALYRNPTFTVEQEGIVSDKHLQHTGIRQGCPMSPYLFILVMNAIFHDIEKFPILPSEFEPKHNRIQNTNFNEILYADDTICIARTAKAMQTLINRIQMTGEKY